MVQASGELVGRVIANKYAVQSIIGQGAMGVVYRAKQIALDKIVALKVLSLELRDDAEFVARFHTEARAASRLDHPHSTRVLDFGEEPDGLLYIAMELLDGRTLAEVVEQEFPLAPARTASILSQVLSAVGAAHGLKILHRDLKPENIVILEGRDDEERPIDVVKVCDFGIAKLEGVAEPSDGASRAAVLDLKLPATPKLRNATRAGVIIGTPQYMSPEQARGEKLDVRSDLYALGVVLYEMLTSRAPFDDGTAAEVLYQHASVEPPRPSEIYRGVDLALEAICLRALRKQREERYASAREMRVALRAVLDAPRAPDESSPAPLPPPRVRLHDTSIPTISATAMLAEPKSRSRALWLIPAVAVAVGAWALVAHRLAPAQAHVEKAAPTQTQTQMRAAPAQTDRVQSPAPTSTLATRVTSTSPMTMPTAMSLAMRHSTNAPVTNALVTNGANATSQPTEADPAPPPPPPTQTVATSAPPPPPTATVVAIVSTSTGAPAIVQHADPSRVHVDLGAIQADRVGSASVDAALRHVDFTGCYRTEVAASRETDGVATLAIEMDEERITRADLVGGAFSPGLRRCIADRTLGMRIRNADTGGATAKVTLRFFLR